MYSRRADTSGSRDQVYETNLLSLFYFRAVQDDIIEQFELCTNTELVDTFGEVRFKIKVKGYDKPGTVFVQTLHKTNKKLKIDLAAYFDTYMNIKPIFDETEWLFVIYTNATVDTQYIDTSVRSGLSTKLNDILETGGMVKSPNNEENMEYLTKITVKDQITSLAKTIASCIKNQQNFSMMSDELILRYHVILTQKVLNVSDIQPQSEDTPRYRIASFRQDFFDNTEEYIILFRDTLYSDIIKRRKLKHLPLSDLSDDLTDATRLSKLIGTFVTYNNGQLEFDKKLTENIPNIKPIQVPPATVKKAVEIAAVEILSSTKFKVPAAFGNKDFTISGNDAEIEKRICHFASTMKELLDKCDASKIVTIDESLEDEFLELEGGIAGAIGNIFVLDDNTKFMKITDNWESLNTLGQRLYRNLSDIIHNIQEYKFCFKVDKFPELTFANYGEKKARDFLNNFIIYCNQAEENDVQEILKSEIEDVQRNKPNYFQIKSDTIFLLFQNEIQKWRMRQQVGPFYKGKSISFFRESINSILFNSLISIISELYVNKIKKYDYTFTEDAVWSLNLPNRPSSTIVVTENCELTVIKVLQHLRKNQEHYVLLDIEYLASLPVNDQNALRAELENANQEDVLILICDKIDFNHKKTFENIAHTVRNTSKIVILNQKSSRILQIYFPEADNILNDKKFSLIDVDIQSQKSILNNATAVFPGVEIRLGVFLRGWPRTGHASAAGGTATVADKNKADDRPLVPAFRSADHRIPSDDTQKQLISIGEWKSKSTEDTKSAAGGTAAVANKNKTDAETIILEMLKQLSQMKTEIEELRRQDAAMWAAGDTATVANKNKADDRLLVPAFRSADHRIPSDDTQKQLISIGKWKSKSTEDTKSAAGGTAAVAKKNKTDAETNILEMLEQLSQMKTEIEERRRQDAAMWVARGAVDVADLYEAGGYLLRPTWRLQSADLRNQSDDTEKQLILIEEWKSTEDARSAAGGTAAVADKNKANEETITELLEQQSQIMEERQRPDAAVSTAGGTADVAYKNKADEETSILELLEQQSQIMEERQRRDAAMHKLMQDTGTLFDPNSTFNSRLFYEKFKDADFLKSDANVERILMQGHELLEKVNLLEPGMTMIVDGMNLCPDTPLIIKKVGQNIEVGDFEFTYNRLVGLIVAYVHENRHRFPKIHAMEAEDLGLEWDQNDDEKCKLYLSAVSGSEYFTDQFSFVPLLCGLVKYIQNKLPVDDVLKMGHIQNANGQTMVEVMNSNLITAQCIWWEIPDTSGWSLRGVMGKPEFEKMFDA